MTPLAPMAQRVPKKLTRAVAPGAPVAVARAAGLHVSRIDGGELRYNQPDPYLPDLLICRPELAEEALRALAG